VAVLADGLERRHDAAAAGRRFAAAAAGRGADIDMLTSTPAPSGRFDGHLNFAPTAWRPSAPHVRGRLAVPPLVEVLDHLEEHDFTAIHVTSAGPMGLVGLVAARLLHVPVTGSYAGGPSSSSAPTLTETPRCSGAANGTSRRYELWFYRRLDEVVAPSRAAARELVALGLAPGRVRVPPGAAQVARQETVEGGAQTRQEG
jgi:hypothetical protein